MEVRLHGRGGQGGVTCAKLLAAAWARLGKSVQAFGDYAGERSGAPVRAYLRVDDAPITNRNKVYAPDHLLVLDPILLDAAALLGLRPGGTMVVNTPEAPEVLARRYPGFRVATVDATGIARGHGIGSRSVVIVNTTIAGAFARALDLPWDALEGALRDMRLTSDLPAAQAAWDAVAVAEPVGEAAPAPKGPGAVPVVDLVDHHEGKAPALRTGSWRTQAPEYHTRPAPCAAICPAGNDVVGFVQALATQGEDAAAKVLAETSPLPGVCGRVCPGPCVTVCNRASLDGAVDTRGLERWIADHAMPAPTVAPATGKRAAVVGSGPAGLSAAWQLAMAGWSVDLYDLEAQAGGLLRTGIPPWRLPRAVLDREVERILALGVRWHGHERFTPERVAALDADATILATGLMKQTSVDLGVGALNGVEQGLDFLAAANRGLKMELSGHVVVLGGGNTAIDCARTALRKGAAKVTVVYRRTREQMPAIREEVLEAEEEGVLFEFLRAPLGVYGDDHVGGVECAVMEASERGGRLVDTGHRAWIDADLVLLALGQSADHALLPEGWTVRDGQAHAGDRALPVFLAGDFATNEGTVAHAIGHGRKVADRARRFVGEAVVEKTGPAGTPVGADDLRLDWFDRRTKAPTRLRPVEERLRTSAEVSLGLESAIEAIRCFSCGHCTHCDTCLAVCPEGIILRAEGAYAVDLSQCKGCGLCVHECPRAAMEMVAS